MAQFTSSIVDGVMNRMQTLIGPMVERAAGSGVIRGCALVASHFQQHLGLGTPGSTGAEIFARPEENCRDLVPAFTTPSGASPQDALRIFLDNPRAQFKSLAQLHLVHALALGQEDVIATTGCGEGKTFSLFFVSSMFDGATAREPQKKTVLIVPYVALLEEILRTADKLGVKPTVWTQDNPSSFGAFTVTTYDQCVHPNFLGNLHSLQQKGKLARIVLDEAHAAITDARFRPVMHQLGHLRLVGARIIMLSGTLPPKMVSLVARKLRVGYMASARRLRSFDTRRNAQFKLQESVMTDWPSEIRDLVSMYAAKKHERALVICYGHEDIRKLANSLGAPCYYAGQTPEQNKAAMNLYLEGNRDQDRILVASTAIISGTNIDGCTLTIQAGRAPNMLTAIQALNRGGRKGENFTAVILHTPYSPPTIDPDDDPCGEWALYNMLHSPRAPCIRQAFDAFVNGEGISCSDFDAFVPLCSQCPARAHRYNANPLVDDDLLDRDANEILPVVMEAFRPAVHQVSCTASFASVSPALHLPPSPQESVASTNNKLSASPPAPAATTPSLGSSATRSPKPPPASKMNDPNVLSVVTTPASTPVASSSSSNLLERFGGVNVLQQARVLVPDTPELHQHTAAHNMSHDDSISSFSSLQTETQTGRENLESSIDTHNMSSDDSICSSSSLQTGTQAGGENLTSPIDTPSRKPRTVRSGRLLANILANRSPRTEDYASVSWVVPNRFSR